MSLGMYSYHLCSSLLFRPYKFSERTTIYRSFSSPGAIVLFRQFRTHLPTPNNRPTYRGDVTATVANRCTLRLVNKVQNLRSLTPDVNVE